MHNVPKMLDTLSTSCSKCKCHKIFKVRLTILILYKLKGYKILRHKSSFRIIYEAYSVEVKKWHRKKCNLIFSLKRDWENRKLILINEFHNTDMGVISDFFKSLVLLPKNKFN